MISLLGIGIGIATVSFAVVWAICVRIRNYAFLDVAWSYAVAVLAPVYSALGPGDSVRKWVATGIGVAWSVRLGTHLLVRVVRHHPSEDPRYQTLRKRWDGPAMFLAFFELQAVIAVIFSLPFLLAAFNAQPTMALVEWLGLGVALIGLAGESVADAQMTSFKRDPASKGRVCQKGLWKWSRHPNYFFEFVVWVGFCVFAFGSPWGGITVICPILMLYFLLRVTGIPLTEEYSIESKGDAYREYQRTTSAFVPWFRRKP